MAISDILIVLGVFAFLGFIILSRMKEKNPKRHAAMMGFLRNIEKGAKDKVKSQQAGPHQIVLPDNARIM